MNISRIIVVDDHPVFREGLKQVVSRIADIEVVAEADTGDAALVQIRHLKPDIVLLDLAMPGMDGLKLLELTRDQQPVPIVVIVTSYDDKAYLDRAFELGARGYVLKDSAVTDVVDCLDQIRRGGIYISPSLGRNKPLLPALDSDGTEALAKLTPSEKQVLRMVSEFKTSKEIAAELSISFRTVQNHRSHICTKLNLHGSHQLMGFAAAHAQLLADD